MVLLAIVVHKALFMLKSCIDYLTEHKSNVYIASLGISKGL